MGRPKLASTAAEISAQIARVQRETLAQVKQLEERRRTAEARENQRRGELIVSYLAGAKRADLRRILRSIVEKEDRQLFELQEQHGHMTTTTNVPATDARASAVTAEWPEAAAP
jgi:hypothetical protein